MSGIPYLLMSLTNAAVSFMVAEQFSESIQMEAITRASKYGRTTGTCHLMECPLLNGKLREVTDWLAGVEELLGYVVNSGAVLGFFGADAALSLDLEFSLAALLEARAGS